MLGKQVGHRIYLSGSKKKKKEFDWEENYTEQ